LSYKQSPRVSQNNQSELKVSQKQSRPKHASYKQSPRVSQNNQPEIKQSQKQSKINQNNHKNNQNNHRNNHPGTHPTDPATKQSQKQSPAEKRCVNVSPQGDTPTIHHRTTINSCRHIRKHKFAPDSYVARDFRTRLWRASRRSKEGLQQVLGRSL
jgi:hypothetical protein